MVLLMSGFFSVLCLCTKSWKPSVGFGIFSLLNAVALYFTYKWQHLEIVVGIMVVMILLFLFGVWYISEPDINLMDRFKSPEKLVKGGQLKEAARKYEKKGDYSNAAKLYEKIGWLESAAWAYEKVGDYIKVAEIYERLYEKENDVYYLKESYEFWKKVGNLERAGKVLEKYAEAEPWFWEDVAKHYEELKDEDAIKAWKRALEYYLKEAEEEGVFWEDVGNIYKRLGDLEKAKEAWRKFLDYCFKEVENDKMWWKHIAETYELLSEKERAKEAWGKYEEYRKSIMNG